MKNIRNILLSSAILIQKMLKKLTTRSNSSRLTTRKWKSIGPRLNKKGLCRI